MAKKQALDIIIGVKDAASDKIAKFLASLNNFSKKAQVHLKGVGDFASGIAKAGPAIHKIIEPARQLKQITGDFVAGITKLGLAINKITQPARKLNASLRDLDGLDGAELSAIKKSAYSLAFSYGSNIGEVISASVALQRSFEGINGHTLAAITKTTGTLAVAVKKDVGNVATYMGQMYTLFSDDAIKMGGSAWADKLAGQTNLVAKNLHTDVDSIREAFSDLGTTASRSGISMAEQMAVLAAGGSNAGNAYADMLLSAQKKKSALGISFTAKDGSIRGMDDILSQVKQMYGSDLSKVQQDALDKSLGTSGTGKFINTLLKNHNKLSKTIGELANVSNGSNVAKFAKDGTDAFSRFGGAIDSLSASFWQKLLPTLEKWINKATVVVESITRLIETYPNITRVMGNMILLITTAGTALVSLSFAYNASTLAGELLLATLSPLFNKLSFLAEILKTVAITVMGHLSKALLFLTGVFKTVAITIMGHLSRSLFVLAGGLRAVALAIWANPIFLLVGVIVAIVAAIGLLIYKWQDVKSYLADSSWGGSLLAVMESIENGWNSLTDLFTNFSWTQLLQKSINLAMSAIEPLIVSLGKLLDFAGLDIGQDMMNFKAENASASIMSLQSASSQVSSIARPAVVAGAVPNTVVPAGGLIAPALARASMVTGANGKSVTIATQNVYLSDQPANLNDIAAMAN